MVNKFKGVVAGMISHASVEDILRVVSLLAKNSPAAEEAMAAVCAMRSCHADKDGTPYKLQAMHARTVKGLDFATDHMGKDVMRRYMLYTMRNIGFYTIRGRSGIKVVLILIFNVILNLVCMYT